MDDKEKIFYKTLTPGPASCPPFLFKYIYEAMQKYADQEVQKVKIKLYKNGTN